VLKALGREPVMVLAADHFDVDWQALWRERISEQGRLTHLGWTAKMRLEAHVVNIRCGHEEGREAAWGRARGGAV
jgi:hypothetical protein